MFNEILTVKEVAKYLKINEKKVYAMAKAHKIPCTKVTGKWLFPKKIIDEWIMTSARGHLAKPQWPKEAEQKKPIKG